MPISNTFSGELQIYATSKLTLMEAEALKAKEPESKRLARELRKEEREAQRKQLARTRFDEFVIDMASTEARISMLFGEMGIGQQYEDRTTLHYTPWRKIDDAPRNSLGYTDISAQLTRYWGVHSNVETSPPDSYHIDFALRDPLEKKVERLDGLGMSTPERPARSELTGGHLPDLEEVDVRLGKLATFNERLSGLWTVCLPSIDFESLQPIEGV